MNIFKDRKFFTEKQLKRSGLLRRIYNLTHKILIWIGVLFNGIMFLMMVTRLSLFCIFFLVNLYFIAMLKMNRGLKVE